MTRVPSAKTNAVKLLSTAWIACALALVLATSAAAAPVPLSKR